MDYNGNVWYGKYGGCFISDAFTLSCDRYYKKFCEIVADARFQEEYQKLKAKYTSGKCCFTEDVEHARIVCHIDENYGPLLGTALLGKYLGKSAVCGARYADEAWLCARVCAALQVPLQLFLSRELSGIRSLTDQLELMGVTLNTEMCNEVFNLPEMYAFQAWISAPEEKHLILCRSNVGAFPQTNIAAAFAADFRRDMMAEVKQKYGSIQRIIIPTISGTEALAVATAADWDTEFVCVECDTEPELEEELDSYCGSFTKVLRNNITDRVIAAELAELEDQGRVRRVRMEPRESIQAQGQNAEVETDPSSPLSLQSMAALAYCENNPAKGQTLVIVRSLRWGGAV